MHTIPNGSPELTQARRDEIVRACETLYQSMSFREITIKEIACFTSLTRPSIYNYFQTKEEIFLALLQQEYERWRTDLEVLAQSDAPPSRQGLAQGLACTLERRPNMLRPLSTSLNDMGEKSRPEKLVEFKTACGASIEAVRGCLSCFCPDMGRREQNAFIAAFFPLLPFMRSPSRAQKNSWAYRPGDRMTDRRKIRWNF